MNEFDKELFNENLKQRLFGGENEKGASNLSLDISYSKIHRREKVREFKKIYNQLWKHPERINWDDEKYSIICKFLSLEEKKDISQNQSPVSLNEDKVIVRKRKPRDMRDFVSKQIINVREH